MTKELDLNSETLVNYFYKNLEGLSNIKEGYKLYINGDNVIIPDEPYMFQGLWRYYNNIKRQDAIDVITHLFDNIERYYNSLYIKSCISKNKSKNINLPEIVIFEFKTIIDKMKLSLLGINHLLKTYEKDTNTVDIFNKIIININTMICNFTKLTSTNFI
jgi:hypothetical protein